MHIPTSEEIAWAAGLLEGEGTITLDSRNSAPILRMVSADLDVIQTLQARMGGRINGPRHDKRYPEGKPLWTWTVNNWEDGVRIVTLIQPWLGERRSRAASRFIAAMPARFRRPRAAVMCDEPVTASVAGYLRHRRKGERACRVCLDSSKLYYQQRLERLIASGHAKPSDHKTVAGNAH